MKTSVTSRLVIALALLVVGVVVPISASASATTSATAPETLARARVIRADVNARYRSLPGRKLLVTEASTMAVVERLALQTDWLEQPRVVPANNGIYFAICPARATCPYPSRSAARPAAAFLPRRQALELAIRTFLDASPTLVVVALPTAEPIWLVFERDDVLAEVDERTLLARLANPAAADSELRETVERITLPRLFRPLPVLPPQGAIYAARLVEP